MIATQVKPATPLWLRVLKRLIWIVVLAFLIGVGMRHMSRVLEQGAGPAGFGRGMMQGALMPCALPNLLVGTDVSIYNPNNTGVPYKLGYTCGVNVCGAFFFGLFFLRLSRLRKSLNGATRGV